MPDNIAQLFKATVSLMAVLVLIAALFFVIRYLTKRAGGFGANRLKVLDHATVLQNTAVAVISVCGKLMLVGSGTGSVNKICDIDMTEEEYHAYGRAAGTAEVAVSTEKGKMSFADALKVVIANKLEKH